MNLPGVVKTRQKNWRNIDKKKMKIAGVEKTRKKTELF
jgi:hypothetical protein